MCLTIIVRTDCNMDGARKGNSNAEIQVTGALVIK